MGKLYSLISAILLAASASFAADPINYEYWIDNNYEAKTSGSLTPGANTYEIDMQGVRKGLHRFNYRLQTEDGVWGAPFAKYFYCVSNAARFSQYEYWLDKDYDNRVSANVSSNSVSFEVDLSNFDKSGGAHFFNLRTRDGDGDWSPVYRKLLLFNSGNSKTPIIGYRHFLNGDDLGYVEVERKFVDKYMFDVDLPDSVYPSVKNLTPTFDGDRVSLIGTDSIDYTINVRTELGWAAPQNWRLGISNDFSTTAVAMEINSKHTFSAPKDYEFAAIRFSSASDSLYFQTDIPVALDIYHDGERKASLTPSQVKGMSMLNLEPGEYFGVLHSVGDKEAETFTLQIMDVADRVPSPEISFEDGLVSIVCVNKEAEIHYTVDDPNVTAESPLYTEPFRLDRNATVRAIAIIPNLDIEPSVIAEFIVDTYKVATPIGEFDLASRLLTLNCATEGAAILYAYDKEGEWTAYTGPISISQNCMVFFRATLDGYNDSDIAEIVIDQLSDNVVVPAIDFIDGKVTITCETADAEIRYTLDGTVPTATSTLYEGPFELLRNATVKAIAILPGLDIDPSEVAELTVDSYKVSTPYGEFDSSTRLLTLRSDTEGASIQYSFREEEDWQLYSSPIQIEGNATIHAKAILEGYNDSDIANITVSELACSPVSFGYDGRYLSLNTDEPGATILYSTDGSAPSNGLEYTGRFDIGGICTVRAVAVKDSYMNSEVTELIITHYADEDHAETSSGGLLSSAFEWEQTLPNSVDTYRIEGMLNDADYAFLRSMDRLRHLDMKKAAEARIPDGAFKGTKLISLSLPEDLAEIGDSILSGASLLSSLIWNAKTAPESNLMYGIDNPNMLLYAPEGVDVSGVQDYNTVSAGEASEIVLHYGYPYYAARELHAARVSITHEFIQTTEVDICRGWETMVIPFAPQSIIHETKGAAVPFAAWDGDTEGMKPFWLYSSVSEGWEAVSAIEACVPYIISMPNNKDYVESNNLAGQVTFSAENVDLGPDTNPALSTPWKEGTLFMGTFLPVEEEGILTLNVGDDTGGLLPGSTFVTDNKAIPFSAYISGASGRRAMPVFGDLNSVDFPSAIGHGLLIETPAPGNLRISSIRERNVTLTTTTGVILRTVNLLPGETVLIEGLTRGLYIIGGAKVMVR